MDYTDFTNAMQQLLVLTDTFGKAALTALLPRIIDDAEGLIYKDAELDFLWQRITDASPLTAPRLRAVPIPATFRVVEGANLIVPATKFPTDDGARRIPMLRVDKVTLDQFWPSESRVLAPDPFSELYFAIYSQERAGKIEMQDDAGVAVDVLPDATEPGELPSTLLIAPTPDGEYHVEVFGTGRPEPLSADNPKTVLATLYPELFLAAAMVFGCALTKNWSAMAEDPRSAVSWKAHFADCRLAAVAESQRQKAQGPVMTPSGPSPYPPRPEPPGG